MNSMKEIRPQTVEQIVGEQKIKNLEVRTVNQWMYRKDLAKGYTIANAKYTHDFRRLRKLLRKNALLLYTLAVELEDRKCSKMMHSAKKQADFCGAVVAELGVKKVEPEHVKLFKKDIAMIENRLERIDLITKENIHLSEFEPFFEHLGDAIDDMDYKELADKARAWNEEHKDIVAKHMEEIKPELDRHAEWIKRKQEARKAEKEAEKQRKKEENAYIKEMRDNHKKHRQEYKRIERTFERYYDGRV